MGIDKITGRNLPYRSQTFRNTTEALVQRNGVLWMDGEVRTEGTNVIVPPFVVIQHGLIYSKDDSTTIGIPAFLSGPYFVTVSAPSPTQTNDLTFQFAKNPAEINDLVVCLAEYDGVEWRQLERVSIDGILKDINQTNVDLQGIGPKLGVITEVVGLNYRNTKGIIIDKSGRKVRADEVYSTPVVPADPDWRRVDRMVLRKPVDSESRIGVRKVVVGGAYKVSGPDMLADTQLSNGSEVNGRPRCVIDSANNAHFFYARGFGSEFSLVYVKYSSNRSTVMVPEIVLTTIDTNQFDVAIDKNNEIHLVFADSGNIRWLKLSNTGGILSGPVTCDNQGTQCLNPKVAVRGEFVYLVYQSILSFSNSQIFFASRTLSGSSATASKKITVGNGNLINPSLAVTDDMMVYVAYEDSLSGRVQYAVYDDIGVLVTSPKIISEGVSSTSYGTLNNYASKPVIKVFDNKSVVVAFLQKKSSQYMGVCIHREGSSFMPNLISSVENFTDFCMVEDSFMNEIYLCACQSGRVDYLKLENYSPVLSLQLSTAGGREPFFVKDNLGALVHTWAELPPGTYTNLSTPQYLHGIGPFAQVGGLDNLVLATDQVAFKTEDLTITPEIGHRITIAGSSVAGNNTTFEILGVELASIDASGDYYILKTTQSFAGQDAPASMVTAQFQVPNGNGLRFVKSVAEVSEVRALRTDTLKTDILLARMMLPGPIVLNYIPATGHGANSDLMGVYGDVVLDWSATTPGAFTLGTGLKLLDLVTDFNYTVNSGTFPMTEGTALYVLLDGVTGTITPQVTPVNALPWSLPIQVLGYIKAGDFQPHLLATAGLGQLQTGEGGTLGQDLSNFIRERLGIDSDTAYAPYSSTAIIAPADPYPTAIGKLDAAVDNILSSHAQEEYFTVEAEEGETIFDTEDIEFFPDDSFPDIQVLVNGRRVSAGATRDYRKITNSRIEFNYTLPKDALVVIRQERTGGAGGSGGGGDLQNITVPLQPFANGGRSLGTVTKAWGSLFLKDTVTNQVYQLSIVNGVASFEEVP